jgi:hypothetical protein
MIKNTFGKTINRYLTEADVPPPPDAGGAPPPDAGGAPAPGGDAPPPPDAGGMPDIGGGLGGGLGGPGDPMGGPGGDPNAAQGSTTENDICSERYVRIVSYLCELYNANVSSRPKMVLNLKVKVGETYNLNDKENAKNVFSFMVDNLLNSDVKKEVEKSVKAARKAIKKMKEEGKLAGKTAHNSTSPFIIDATTAAYTAVCSNALGESIPEINYGITKEYRVDPKNAKAVFDEIKSNTDQIQKLSEVENK